MASRPTSRSAPADLRTGGDLPPGWEAALREWRSELRAGGLAESTIRLRLYQIGKTARALDCDPWQVTRASVLAWWAEQDWSPERRKSDRAALISFYTWATTAGHCDGSWVRTLRGVRIPPSAPKPIPDDVLADVLDRTTGRARLMIQLGAFVGLRADEIARVRVSDLTPQGLRVLGKGGRVRVVPLTLTVTRAITDHIDSNHIPPGGWLFPAGRGRSGPILGASAAAIVKRALPPPWTCHCLRHRFATACYRGTHDLRAVQTLMGHSKAETTGRYIQLADDDLVAAVLAAGDTHLGRGYRETLAAVPSLHGDPRAI